MALSQRITIIARGVWPRVLGESLQTIFERHNGERYGTIRHRPLSLSLGSLAYLLQVHACISMIHDHYNRSQRWLRADATISALLRTLSGGNRFQDTRSLGDYSNKWLMSGQVDESESTLIFASYWRLGFRSPEYERYTRSVIVIDLVREIKRYGESL